MKKLSVFAIILALVVLISACGYEKSGGGYTENDTPIVNPPVDDKTDDDYQDYSDDISKEKLISMFTSDGGVWQIPGSMWHQVRFTRNGDELEYLEFDDRRWNEGTVTFSADGTEMRWHGENDVVGSAVLYWEGKDINNLEYNEFYLTDSSFSFSGYDYWVKGNEDTFNNQLELYGD